MLKLVYIWSEEPLTISYFWFGWEDSQDDDPGIKNQVHIGKPDRE